MGISWTVKKRSAGAAAAFYPRLHVIFSHSEASRCITTILEEQRSAGLSKSDRDPEKHRKLFFLSVTFSLAPTLFTARQFWIAL